MSSTEPTDVEDFRNHLDTEPASLADDFEQRPVGETSQSWRLRLYVAGESPKSVLAFANLKALCETHMAGQYEIEIVDLLQNPRLARGDEIIAIPTLVRQLPHPMRKIIGDLSDTDSVLIGLQISVKQS